MTPRPHSSPERDVQTAILHYLATRDVKSPVGRLSEDQINFGAMITRFGGVFVVARSVADVETALAPFLTPGGGPP
jgi:hypothetical protein